MTTTLADRLVKIKAKASGIGVSQESYLILTIATEQSALLRECASLIGDWKEEYGMGDFADMHIKLKEAGYGE